MSTQLPLLFEVISLSIMIILIIGDLLYVYKKPHVPSMLEATLWVIFYVSLALIFALLLLWFAGSKYAVEFVAGWLTEYSLSIDNLFVFIIIMARFAVPKKLQQEVLMVGIIIALILRAIFIILGAQLIEHFSFVFYIFGIFLILTAVKQALPEKEEKKEDPSLIKFLKKTFRFVDEYHGSSVVVKLDGKRFLTPMFLVFVAIGSTDLLFAIDSIPAIFGITTSPFIVFTANLFALMGLRQLYFLLGGLLDKLIYLKYGIAAILAFIGVKLFLHALHENELPFINNGEPLYGVPEISTAFSLGFIVFAMLVSTVASLLVANKKAKNKGDSLHLGAADK